MHQDYRGRDSWAALWEMAESSGVGIEVDLKKMAIRQETVEICEYFHLNPYQLTSAGSVLIFAEDGEKLVEKFQKEGRQGGRSWKDDCRYCKSHFGRRREKIS